MTLPADGRRYLARRMERALDRGVARGGPDGPRPRSFWVGVGAVVAAAAAAGAAALSTLRPGGDAGDSRILMDRDSGALYVRVEDTLHPVLNLTSAHLLTGHGGGPRAVRSDALAPFERGPTLGIPGAPAQIGAGLDGEAATWAVCDGPRTVVLVGTPAPPDPLDGGEAVFVTGPSGTTHLLYAATRAVVDVADPGVSRALRFDRAEPVPVSAGLLNLLPEAPPLVTPRIPGAGNPGPGQLSGLRVGDVVSIERSSGAEYFVVLEGGVQPVSGVAADLIRAAGATAERVTPTLSPDVLSAVPIVGTLAVASYPDRVEVSRQGERWVCVHWAAGRVTITTAGALPLPQGRASIRLARADGAGHALDEVSLPPGRSLYVRAERGPGGGALITDTGVRFAVDADAAGLLGLPEHPMPAPWPLVAALPEGPELSRAAASVQRDVPTAATPHG
ncbi:type VII secretion protein EccB [Mycobacterium sp. ACS4331]|uniref:type VII secretion protein EccB n=1 Tax=Mycobacterium sp. ACS4331 TaxID=1834121 RepID=UPI000A75D04C|nr:type VII secretion protein EccB [Mycobacterium sp. ACS4331]